VFDPKRLLEDFIGGGQPSTGQQPAQGGMKDAADLMGGFDRQKAGTFAAGAATGGLLGLLLGSKKVRKLGGGLLGYGGAAVLGGLAYKAWQNYQSKQGASTEARNLRDRAPASGALTPVASAPAGSAFDPMHATSADGRPFALALIRAMISAAKADGHIDAKEQGMLHARIGEMSLDADAKAFVFDELGRPADLDVIAALPRGPEQAAEIWLASRLACDPDDARERAYLSTLAAKLKLPADLLAQLDAQAASAALPVAAR
jgi:uncharacterized membrane protein YebE (DUF533 family)